MTPKWLNSTRQARRFYRPPLSPRFLDRPQSNADWFDLAPAPFVAYPLAGAAAVDVYALTVPAGLNAVIRQLAIVNTGGNQIDGTGQVVWRILVNHAGLRGYNNIQSQIGQMDLPVPTYIPLIEGDYLEVTVQVPAGQQDMPAGSFTACRLVGWYYPSSFHEEDHHEAE